MARAVTPARLAVALFIVAAVLALAWPVSAQSPQDAPAKPSRPTVDSVWHDSVTISWSDPGDFSITGYQVLRRNGDTDAPGDFTVIENDTGDADTSYTDTTVSPSTRYSYRVKARNSHGLSPRSGFVKAKTPEAPVPAMPTGLTGDVSHDSVSLSWDDPGDDSITGYQVLRRDPNVQEAGEFVIVVDDTGSNATSYVDSTVEAGKRYFYRAKARNALGLSVKSALFKADTPEEDATPRVDPTPTPVPTPTPEPEKGDGDDQGGSSGARDQLQSPAESVSEPEDGDFSTSIDNTGWVVVGDPWGATGNLSANDLDGFKINLDAGRRYSIDVLVYGYRDISNGGTFEGKPELQLLTLSSVFSTNLDRLNGYGDVYVSNHQDISHNVLNQGSGPDNGARTEFDVEATDTYLIRVKAFGTETGTYTVKARDITSEEAHGDFTSGFNGGRVKIDDDLAMIGNIRGAGDNDWYLALLEEDKCYAFHVKGQHSDSDHDGGTLNDPKLSLMKFYDYYEKQYYDPDTRLYKKPDPLNEDYYETVYIDPAKFEIIGSAETVCFTATPDDTGTAREFCTYYCDDDGGEGNNAKMEVEVGTGAGGEYLIGVSGVGGSTGTYSVYVEEITCPTS